MEARLKSSVHVDPRLRLSIIIYFIALSFTILIGKLLYLQIIKGDIYKSFSERNRIAKIWIPATRGIIYDRYNKIIVNNRASFNLTITKAYVKDVQKTATFMDEFLGLGIENIERVISKISSTPRYRPIPIDTDIGRESLAKVETYKLSSYFDGINVDVVPVRYYVHGEIGAHLLGYLGEINEKMMKLMNNGQGDNPYKLGDLTGKFGIEQKYEKFLRGFDGIKAVEIDARGRIRHAPLEQISVSDLERKATSGLNLNLSIDLDIEKIAYNAFSEGESGSLVAMNVKNGELIAMVSKPSFDPSLFAGGIEKKLWDQFNQDPHLPLMDRAIKGLYPPGSVFKIIIAIAALEEKEIDLNTTIHCTGGVQFANRFYRCWKKEGHGQCNVRKALIHSCDSFFYRVGLKVGVDKIYKYATMFGLGAKSGILLNNEKSGLIPSSAWKKKVLRDRWYDGETLSTSIGQGYNQVTTLQLTRMMAAIANKGTLFVPKLLISVSDNDNNLYEIDEDEPAETIKLSEKTWNTIHDALTGVVNEPGGTAYWSARMEKYVGAGKTGTAQVVKMAAGERVKSEELELRFRDHALFVEFAPSSDPEIAVAVIAEHGGHGSSAAAPKAKAVIEAYLDKMHPPVNVNVETKEKTVE